MKMLTREEMELHLAQEAKKLNEAFNVAGVYTEKDVLRLILTLDYRQGDLFGKTITDMYLNSDDGDGNLSA